jgi:hypothetical protein
MWASALVPTTTTKALLSLSARPFTAWSGERTSDAPDSLRIVKSPPYSISGTRSSPPDARAPLKELLV